MLTGEARYPVRPVVAVGAVVFRAQEVLLVQRRQPPNAELWAIPGGSVELGESLQAAAEREIVEETGVIIRAGEPIYSFDVIDHDERGGIRYHYVIVDLLADYLEGEPTAGSDALEARWVTAAEFDTLPTSRTTVELLRHRLRFGNGPPASATLKHSCR